MSVDVQFQALTGYYPMQWQRRLIDRLATGLPICAIDLPTGLGKTSVMAIWLIARADGANVPRRLVYVVDRRAVVDQATEEAEKLRKALLGQAKHFEKLEGDERAKALAVAAELNVRVCGKDGALPISTLRGAYADNREWLNDPTSPAIIVGTIDMIGSRLLFSGYGVSRKMRPYHAGLLGADTLVVLDEAHLVPPFEELLRTMEEGKEQFGAHESSDREIIPPLRLLSLSATGRTRTVEKAQQHLFRLEEEDFADEIVMKRLSAKKHVRIHPLEEKQTLVDALAEQAWRLAQAGERAQRCLVYCDSRDVAEKVERKLKDKAGPTKKGSEPTADTELFVGARRVRERECAKEWLRDHGFLADSTLPEKSAFLIATSAGEVGIDLDADHLVCDVAPWERMVQRLGRVNRRGDGDAMIIVVDPGEPKFKKPDAPTDQEKRQLIAYRSLELLRQLPDRGKGKDASPGALRALKLLADTDSKLAKKIVDATTPEPLHPALTRPVADAWAMTSLETHSGRPDVAPWLRGWIEDDEPQTIVVWRRFLPVRENGEMLRKDVEAFFEAAPPHESEKLETETHRVIEWLQQRAATLLKAGGEAVKASATNEDAGEAAEAATAEQQDFTEERTPPLRRNDIVAISLSAKGAYRPYGLEDLAQERKGAAAKDFQRELATETLAIDTRFGGLHAGLLDSKFDGAVTSADCSDEWSQRAGFRVVEGPEITDKADSGWYFEDEFVVAHDADGDVLRSLVVQHFKDKAQREDARSVSKPQELVKHQSWAEWRARIIAQRGALSAIATESLSLAARLHDEGKRAKRWQRAFRAPREKNESGAYKVFAKTHGPINQAILDGYRHEFGSLSVFDNESDWARELPADVCNRIEWLRREPEWLDLVMHLVASHHGGARPVISVRGCEDAPPSALEARAREVALRFARLQKRWGPWGLAWWEALLRAADAQASRDNDLSRAPPGYAAEQV